MREDYRIHLDKLDMTPLESRVVVIGLGGIGGHLFRPLHLFLKSTQREIDLWLCDGDQFNDGNEYRMAFQTMGHKALVSAGEVIEQSMDVNVNPYCQYVTDENIDDVIPDGACVFCCVDNHATRKLVSEHMETLANATLISGGNDGADDASEGTCGNIQLYVRRDGVDLTAPLTKYHYEIADPQDKNPDDIDCDEAMQAGAVQVMFANLTAATMMLNAFYRVLCRDTHYDEAYFDIMVNKTDPVYLTAPHKESLVEIIE